MNTHRAELQLSYDINGSRCTPQAFYALACNPAQSVAIEACAGAGKTWMLVSRIVRALYDGAASDPTRAALKPDEIVAITFTNKATAEMQQRLNEWLAQFADPATPDETLDGELQARGIVLEQQHSARQTQRLRLRGLYAQVLAQPQGVQFRTFHGWFASWLAQCPLALLASMGLPTQFELLQDNKAAQEAAWQPFFERLNNSADLLADYEYAVHTLGQHPTHAVLQAALAKRQEVTALQETQVSEGAQPRFENTVPDFDEFTGFANFEPSLRGHDTPLAWLTSDAVQRQLQGYAQQLGSFGSVALTRLASELEAACTAWQVSTKDAGAAHAFAAAFEAAAATGSGEPRRYKGVRAADKVEGTPLAERVTTLYSQYHAACAQHQAHVLQAKLLRLSAALIAAYASYKRAQNLLDMDDVEHVAARLMAQPATALWLSQRLDQRVKHLLIDEFQDTSPLQWQTLTAWLDNYAGAAHKPSVLLVGDPKQSIYRFRRADPRVFAAAQWRLAQAFDAPLLRCSHTRRCAQGVLVPLNAVFEAAAEAGEFGNYLAHTSSSEAVGGVWALPFIERQRKKKASETTQAEANVQTTSTDDAEAETASVHVHIQQAEQAADWLVAQLKSGWQPHQIMVLARTRKALSRVASALASRGVAATAPALPSLTASLAVTDVLALCEAALSPGNHLVLAQALKSPMLGWDDSQILQLKANAETRHQGSWWAALTEQETTAYEQSVETPVHAAAFSTSAHDAARHAIWRQTAGRLQLCHDWLHQLPVHDALQRIYAQFDVLLCYQADTENAAKQRSVAASLDLLLAHTLDFAGGRSSSAYAWLRQLRRDTLDGATKATPSTASGHSQEPAEASGADSDSYANEDADADSVLPNHAETAVPRSTVALHTIHTAKGLEADVVLYYDAYPERPPTRTAHVLVAFGLQGVDGEGLRNSASQGNCAQASADSVTVSEGLNFIAGKTAPSQRAWLEREAEAQAREDLNVLYVAMTRARHHLVLSAAQPHQAPKDCAWLRLAPHAQPISASEVLAREPTAGTSAHLPEQGTGVDAVAGWATAPEAPASETPRAETSVFYRLARSSITATPLGEAQTFIAPRRGASELLQPITPEPPMSAAQRLGLALHRVLQHLPLDFTVHHAQALMPAACAEYGLRGADIKSLAVAVNQLSTGENAWIWSSQDIGWYAAELSLADDQGAMRLDRVVHQPTTDTWWILDFKVGAPKSAEQANLYTAQLARYAAAWRSVVGMTAQIETRLIYPNQKHNSVPMV